MYTSFFGFKEKPFQLVPNPAFLYLSRGHEEAMAHLEYAIANGDGFAAITGEVGTGKTTLCRAFLDRLEATAEAFAKASDETSAKATIEAAYIFNPRLNATQLLQAVNDEFGLPAASESNKELIDTLNRFLLARKQAGGQVLLLIDEAQNLSPEVLEQLRLLSNLETSTNKLIQIILVGQPELDQLLASRQLRQLAQRITLRCRLVPLSRNETGDYIRHRLRLVSQGPGAVFTAGAIRAVHACSRGIPRLINIVCDRALLTAFTLERYKITAPLVRRAIRELGPTVAPHHRPRRAPLRLLGPAALVALLFLLFQPSPTRHDDPEPNRMVPVEEAAGPLSFSVPPSPPLGEPIAELIDETIVGTVAEPVAEVIAEPMAEPLAEIASPTEETAVAVPAVPVAPLEPQALASRLQTLDRLTSRRTAIRQVLAMWGVDPEESIDPEAVPDDAAFFRLTAGRHAMLIYRADGDLARLARLNLPAILILRPPGEPEPRYVVLNAREEEKISLLDGGGSFPVHEEELAAFWPGEAYIPWKDFRILSGTIPYRTSEDAVLALKLLLNDLGYPGLPPGPDYDEATRRTIVAIQARHGITEDGIVGSATKIALYNEDQRLAVPHLGHPAGRADRHRETGGLE